MSGNLERFELETCKKCGKIPTEYYILPNRGHPYSFWFFPKKYQNRTNGIPLVLKQEDDVDSLNINVLLNIKYIKCNACQHQFLATEPILRFFRKCIETRQYLTFAEYSRTPRR